VHVKTLCSQKLRMLLTHRKLLQSKAIAIENDLRGTLRNFGLKVGMIGKVRFEARIRELVENLPDLAMLVEPLLVVRRYFASSSPSCIAVCWPLCGTMKCVGA
jgi:transposase